MIKAEDYFKIDEKEREKMRHKLIKKGQKFYQDIIEPTMTAADKGKFVVVEPENNAYFIGRTSLEAVEEAEKSFPNKYFYLVRVGFKSPVSLGGFRNVKR
jgi:hypothetical protein